MLQMTCPHCHKAIELQDERRGRPARCPLCSGGFRAPLEDDEEVRGASRGASWADAVAIAASCVAVIGALLTLGGILVHAAGNAIPVPFDWLRAVVVVPIAIVATSHLVARKVEGPLFVIVSRFAAYVWILCLLVLTLRMI